MNFPFNKLSIAFLVGTLRQGGAERQLFSIVRLLRQQGSRVKVFTFGEGEYWESHLEERGAQVFHVGMNGRRLSRLARLVFLLKADRPSLIQSLHFYTNLYASVAGRLVGLPEVGAMRNDAQWSMDSLGGILGKASLQVPRVLACNSQAALATCLAMRGHARTCYLPNLVDLEEFVPAARPRKKSEFLILGVGNFRKEKRFDRFIETVFRVSQKSGISVRAELIGDGFLRDDLEARAKRLGLHGNVIRFRGRVNELRSFYQAADLLLLTSDFEGTPNVVLEAMACGIPVVSTDAGGLGEMLERGRCGYVSKTGDPDALAELVCTLIRDREKWAQCGQEGRAAVERNHSENAVLKGLAELYSRVLPQGWSEQMDS